MTQGRDRALLGALALALLIAVFGATRCVFFGGVGPARRALGVQVSPGVRTIAEENTLPGSGDWTIDHPALDGEIQAYAGAVSYQRGDTVDVHVSTNDAAKFEADVFRMGWYGGAGARAVQSIKNIDGDDQGRWDPLRGLRNCRSCKLDAATLLLEANWKTNLQIKVRADWVSGYYLIRLRELATKTQTYAIFVVRDDHSSSAALVQASTNTWEAYNAWGDASLYGSFGADRNYIPKTRRAYRVSYDRPYDMRISDSTNYGAGQFFSWEYNFVRWAESQGYDLTYTTNVDVTMHPGTLEQHRLFISLGHDEYWAPQERDAVEAARDAGVNLAFFSGNEAYWQGRLEASSSGNAARVLTVYKDASLDPMAHAAPKQTTVQFSNAPVSRPESLLSGLAYGSNAMPDYQPWRAVGTDNWVFGGTGIEVADTFPGIVGYEYDHMAPSAEQPAGLAIIGSSTVNGFLGSDTASSTVYTAGSGATVFAAGTVGWSWGLDDYGHEARGKFADRRLQKVTANVMNRLAAGPVMAHTPTEERTP